MEAINVKTENDVYREVTDFLRRFPLTILGELDNIQR